MAPKRKKQKGVTDSGVRWSCTAEGLVNYRPEGSKQWKKFRMSPDERDPVEALQARIRARIATASPAASPAARPVDSPSPVPPTSLTFEAVSAPSSDAPPKVSYDCKPQVPQATIQLQNQTRHHCAPHNFIPIPFVAYYSVSTVN
jgi:hypothetical protein